MFTTTDWLDRTLYPNRTGAWDNELFRAAILPRVQAGIQLLDVGAGAGIVEQMRFRERAARVCGIDPTPSVLGNPHLDEAVVGRAEQIPYSDNHFDLVIANNVLEHLVAPARVFQEIARVLKPGGLFLAKTPNRWHYVPIIAAFTPHAFHRWVNGWRGRDPCDTFPTYYRANTRRAVARYAARAGLVVQSIELVESRPEYLRMTAATYLAGWCYERLVNRIAVLWRLRAVMICTFQKPVMAVPSRTSRQSAA